MTPPVPRRKLRLSYDALDREPETLREVLAEYAWHNRGLAKVMEAGYSDQAAIQADYERAVAASDAADARFWAAPAR